MEEWKISQEEFSAWSKQDCEKQRLDQVRESRTNACSTKKTSDVKTDDERSIHILPAIHIHRVHVTLCMLVRDSNKNWWERAVLSVARIHRKSGKKVKMEKYEPRHRSGSGV